MIIQVHSGKLNDNRIINDKELFNVFPSIKEEKK
jgi:hypothetical protein